jgi:hypothetical protein
MPFPRRTAGGLFGLEARHFEQTGQGLQPVASRPANSSVIAAA